MPGGASSGVFIEVGGQNVRPSARAAPEEVAALAVYLASDAAAYVTGSTFVVDGGMMRRAGSF